MRLTQEQAMELMNLTHDVMKGAPAGAVYRLSVEVWQHDDGTGGFSNFEQFSLDGGKTWQVAPNALCEAINPKRSR